MRERAAGRMARPIPFHRPAIDEGDIERVAETIRSGWLTTGPATARLEAALARYLGRRHVVAVSSGTAALQLAYRAAGLGPGDEIILPSLTFVATAEAAIHLGARPVFADVDEETLLIDPEDVARRITEHTRLICPVHYGGQLGDVPRLLELAEGIGGSVVEDAAHALGATRTDAGGQVARAGAGTTGAAFSFYVTKELALGEGGAVATDDDAVAERIRCWSVHGLSETSWTRSQNGRPPTYDVEEIGYKMNLSDLAAALGIGQVMRLEERRARRESLARRYTDGLRGLAGLKLPLERPGYRHAWHLYPIRVNPRKAGLDRDGLREHLSGAGIQTSVHFVPLHEMTYFRRRFSTRSDDCPVTAAAGRELLSLPLYPGLGEDDVDRITAEIRRAIKDHTP